MKILISNDDGIFAPGIAALVHAFSQAGHEVFVCAPDSQRSAASHSLSIGRPITVKQEQLPGAVQAYAIGGTPADCVKLGLTVLCPQAEAVVSGVNRGYNVGTDILYSGTAAAAMEGAICGRPALAVSQSEEDTDYSGSAALAVEIFGHMMAHGLEPMTMLNMNYPAGGRMRGIAVVESQQLHYNEVYTPMTDESGVTSYVLRGQVDTEIKQSDDYAKLLEGYATVTALHANLTDVDLTNAWKRLIGS